MARESRLKYTISGLTLALVLVCALAPTALAQGASVSASASANPSASASASPTAGAGSQQYSGDSAAASVGDGVQDIADGTAQGTGAVDDALSGDDTSSVPPGGVPSASSSVSGVASSGASGEVVAGISALPETGGGSLRGVGMGGVLVVFGLLLLRRGVRGAGYRAS